MSHPELERGDFGPEVEQLQRLLNKAGAMLVCDGDFGPGTQRGVNYAQDVAGLHISGRSDAGLWSWLQDLPEPFPELDVNGVAFIAREETGGLAYYDRVTRWPHFPGHESGITIGVGYDLRFNSEADFRSTWSSLLPSAHLDELSRDIGRKGTRQRSRELKTLGVEVPFKSAWPVLTARTLPRFYQLTQTVYPCLERLPDLCRSVLVSLVFNRGASLTGSRRREMKQIQTILASADDVDLSQAQSHHILTDVEDQLLSMKRLWAQGSGLIARRQAEANLWRKGLRNR